LTLYEPESVGLKDYDLGYDCLADRILHARDGNYFYMRIDTNPTPISVLMRLNPQTGEFTELTNGEIEYLDTVSPDGRYAVLVMDNSGQIDLADYFFDYVTWERLPNAYITIFDTVSGQFVYQSKSFSNSHYLRPVVQNISTLWRGDNCLLLSFAGIQCSISQIVLSDDGYIEGQVSSVCSDLEAGTPSVSPDKRRMLYWNAPTSSMAVIDFSRGVRLPILTPSSKQYRIEFEWAPNGDLIATVNSTVRYTLRLP
jgi:Tol biopolymer transport system component